MARIVDLRSDTVTRPGPDMRRAIADAAVGDEDTLFLTRRALDVRADVVRATHQCRLERALEGRRARRIDVACARRDSGSLSSLEE